MIIVARSGARRANERTGGGESRDLSRRAELPVPVGSIIFKAAVFAAVGAISQLHPLQTTVAPLATRPTCLCKTRALVARRRQPTACISSVCARDARTHSLVRTRRGALANLRSDCNRLVSQLRAAVRRALGKEKKVARVECNLCEFVCVCV